MAALEKSDKYAGIAMAQRFNLPDDDMIRINPLYPTFANFDKETIAEKCAEIDRNINNAEYIGELTIKEAGMYTYLIDTESKLTYAMRLLHEKTICSFDIEAGYACQSFNGMPQYVILLKSFLHSRFQS